MFRDDDKKKPENENEPEKDEIVWPTEPDKIEEANIKPDRIQTKKEDKGKE